MCLLPGSQQIALRPTDHAKSLAEKLKIVLYINVVLMVLMFMSGRIMPGIFDLIAMIIAYLALRNPEGYQPMNMMCFTFFSGFKTIVALTDLLKYAAKNPDIMKLSDFQQTMWLWTSLFGLVVYSASCYFGAMLYNELRDSFSPADLAASQGLPTGGAPSTWGSSASAPNAQSGQQGSYGARPNQPAGFQAFGGRGYSLV